MQFERAYIEGITKLEAKDITYAEELGANSSDLSTLTQDVGALQATVATTQNSQDALQSSWETGLYSALTQAGITGDQAAQDVQNYLNGQPLGSTAAVSTINGYVANAGASPGPGGSSLVAVLANGSKTITSKVGTDQSPGGSSTGSGQPVGNSTYKAPGVVDNPGGGTDAAAVAALTKANATLAKERSSGTAAQIAAAQKNAQNAAKTVESRNAAAKK